MKPQQFFFVLLSAGVIALGLGGFGYVAINTKLQHDSRALSKALSDQEVGAEQTLQLVRLEADYNRLSPLIPKIEAALPKSKNQAAITLQLQQLAAANGFGAPSLTFKSAGTPTPVSQTIKAGDNLVLPITMQLSGTYDQMQNFIKQVQILNRYTNITKLSINKAAGGLTFNLTINAYLKP